MSAMDRLRKVQLLPAVGVLLLGAGAILLLRYLVGAEALVAMMMGSG